MLLSNLFASIKENFLYKKRAVSAEQGKEPSSAAERSNVEKTLPEKKTDAERTMHRPSCTFLNNSSGDAVPLFIRVFDGLPPKKEGSGKKSVPAKNKTVAVEFILETENFGPVILRLEIKNGRYLVTVLVESEEVRTLLRDNLTEIGFLWEEIIKRGDLSFRPLQWKILSCEDRDRLLPEGGSHMVDRRV